MKIKKSGITFEQIGGSIAITNDADGRSLLLPVIHDESTLFRLEPFAIRTNRGDAFTFLAFLAAADGFGDNIAKSIKRYYF